MHRMSNNSRIVPMQLMRDRSVDDFNDQVVGMLDEVERRVEQLREAASLLEQEKDLILDTLNNVVVNTDLLRLGQGDREDINATTNRLAQRTKAVEVVVNTPRSAEQQKALSSVNQLVDGIVQKMTNDLNSSKDICNRYLNACDPEERGPIDQKFQAQIIECTADDQKKIRKKLNQLISQIERAERQCIPQWYNN
ncbi:unnamed protein product [Caenorhabditis auriculariae]|uniref:BAG domain-containing protein n=1 Tax=Caenorhabditis auriculariae TaxID=2777116 RepID=A0A8S1HQ23_9PELO|nr:unnamed protein product [Caenorhabditis auriculariae]